MTPIATPPNIPTSAEARMMAEAAAKREEARHLFLEGLNSDFEELRRDPIAWAEELEERAAWDAISAKVAA